MSQAKPPTKRYVVNLLRSVSASDARSVADRLAADLSLRPEQALKLLTRPPGSLIKPTSQNQADRVAGAFVRVGVAVEVVGADAAPVLLNDPFGGLAAGPLAEPIAPHPVGLPAFGPDLDPVPLDPVPLDPVPLDPVPLDPVPLDPVPLDPVPLDPVPLDQAEPDRAELTLESVNPAAPVELPPVALSPVAAQPEPAPHLTAGPSPTAAPRGPRRTSLLTRILAATLVPAGLIGLGALAFLAYGLPRFSENLIDQSAKELAAAISSNVDVNDLGQTRAQFDAIAASGSVGFVRIELNTEFSNSTVVAKDPDSERDLQHELESFNAANPDGRQTRFRYTDTRAATYRQSLAAATSSPDRAAAQAMLERAAAGENRTTSYLVKTAEVFQHPDGRRTLLYLGEGLMGEPNPDAAALKAQSALYGKKLFTIQVGTILDETERYITSQLVLFLSAVAIMILAAVALALRIARGVANPILALTQAADRISLGELDTPVEVRSRDELGDLAEALERMRTSLQAALERLRRRR